MQCVPNANAMQYANSPRYSTITKHQLRYAIIKKIRVNCFSKRGSKHSKFQNRIRAQLSNDEKGIRYTDIEQRKCCAKKKMGKNENDIICRHLRVV